MRAKPSHGLYRRVRRILVAGAVLCSLTIGFAQEQRQGASAIPDPALAPGSWGRFQVDCSLGFAAMKLMAGRFRS